MHIAQNHIKLTSFVRVIPLKKCGLAHINASFKELPYKPLVKISAL